MKRLLFALVAALAFSALPAHATAGIRIVVGDEGPRTIFKAPPFAAPQDGTELAVPERLPLPEAIAFSLMLWSPELAALGLWLARMRKP